MESCGMSFIKYLLFIFNLLFAISGIGIIAAGAVVLADVGEFNHFVDSELIGPPIVLIVAGAIVFVIAFLGCFGAIRESYNLLIAFAVCLLIIFILELAAGIAAAVYKSDFEDALEKSLKESMEKYTDSENDKIAWDNVQNKFKCCGVQASTDWKNRDIPYSCCYDESKEDPTPDVNNFCVNAGRGKYMHTLGCYSKLQMKIDSNVKLLIGVGIGIAFIEIVGIVLACWLAFTIKRESGEK